MNDREQFEAWYVENVFDLQADPVGSRLCGLQWKAWQAARATPASAVPVQQRETAWEYSFTHSSAVGHGDTTVGPCLTYDKAIAFGVGCFGQREVFIGSRPSPASDVSAPSPSSVDAATVPPRPNAAMLDALYGKDWISKSPAEQIGMIQAYRNMLEVAGWNLPPVEAAVLAEPMQGQQVPDGWQLVPKEPTEAMWSGLARDIVMAWRFNNWTPAKMAEFMESTGHEVPEWLKKEPEMNNPDHTMSKGTCAVLLWKAMLAAAPSIPQDGQKSEVRDDH